MKREGFNGSIGLFRFIFSIVVVLFHLFEPLGYPYVRGGYMPVPFFFMVSGFLMAMSADRESAKGETAVSAETAAYRYLRKRLVTFLPMYWCALLLCIVVRAFYLKIQPIEAFPLLAEISLLHAVIPLYPFFNHTTWYLSVMVYVEPIMYYLFKKDREMCMKIIAPVLTVVFYGGIISHAGNLGMRFESPSIFSIQMIGAIAGISLGVTLYTISMYIVNCPKLQFLKDKRFASAIEFTAFSVSLVYMICTGWRWRDFFILGVLAILVLNSFTNETYLSKITRRPLFAWLQRLSLPIYLFHHAVQIIFFEKLAYLPLPLIVFLNLGIPLLISIPVACLQQRYQTYLKERTNWL